MKSILGIRAVEAAGVDAVIERKIAVTYRHGQPSVVDDLPSRR